MSKPYMGELRRVCPPGLLFHYSQSEHQTFIHAKVHKVQIDNQLLDAYFQTALYSSPIPMYIVKKKGPKPFLEFGMIRRKVPENNIDTFRQFQIIMQEFNVQLDWGFIVSIQDVFSSLFQKEQSEINVSSLDFVSCNDQAYNVLNRKAACDFEEPSSRDFNVCIRCCRDWKSPTALWTS
ncbi:vacuolar protein sorting-associated protein 13A/C [Mytilus galloprovincialis]|uniref:Vacuolar protein sorting-associated protein 13A/C n=1 Tax=Mytilus galloprovincialis TaxID=29158 RepID=A0A8B6FM27_MYTGA|nr:vacuolar protein sorting-associated protein 13A/C [Mytilus galloprovincialis]